ncbi:Cyclopropane mycolic acid synthase 1 [Roseimaritima multifibrata]|uniref:Cyclopropane mycolic acid synthase 1 n=1 Tax=Roseimaritima multifibrata TaxID=1930274 RepID=A0A517MAM0_9BACT|nr:cyclopropane-fatty-acyl-phospholipid synthase family protein [Roseimaritima multifibrata]QDS91901.1 Cyclopropane mycolic acid synthase 1 [Roseimaritima multifibrata]
MFGRDRRSEKQLSAAQHLIEQLAGQLNSRVSVKLWDGRMIPLGENVDPNLHLSISGPGVIGSLVRRPTPENLLKHYARGHIGFHGADLHTFIEALYVRDSRKRSRNIRKSTLFRSLLPFLFESAKNVDVDHEYQGDITGRKREKAENKDFIQFHYDVSNDFYELFLDKEMVYTCGYFTDWDNSLEQAQFDKLDMICRKLQLKPGETFLDIGFGWGSLLCHAAKHYGVKAHGVTLAENQVSYTENKIREQGLERQVTVELKDYADLEGQFDKVASIGMYEHIGIDNLNGFVQRVNSLMPKHGLFMLHGITRPAKETMKKFRRQNAERRLLNKYIFPGGELDHVGHMIQSLECNGFEVADVEGWRNHYMQTCKLWSQRLHERREEAIGFVGEEKYRMWLLYLTGCSLAFKNGGARLYQVLVEKQAKKEPSGMPPTREHLYQDNQHYSANQRRAA